MKQTWQNLFIWSLIGSSNEAVKQWDLSLEGCNERLCQVNECQGAQARKIFAIYREI
jgi:hypothetical protein